jgi:organic hydroperoxide reductase OsmC/OhrA
MEAIYRAEATATVSGCHGRARRMRGCSIRISPFKAFCGSTDRFSPVQLFAAGCAGCFPASVCTNEHTANRARIILSNELTDGIARSFELRARKVR